MPPPFRSHGKSPEACPCRGPWLRTFAALTSLLLLAGCGSVPDASFIQQARENPAPPPKARALVPGVPRGDAEMLDRQIALEEAIVSTPLTRGNRVTLLLDGPATYGAMFAAMRAAQQTINIEFYIVQDDPVGHEFAEIILARRAAGVQVNLIYDSLGSFKTEQAYFDRLRAAGVRVLAFNPLGKVLPKKPWKLNHRDHRKQVIVDGRVAFLGGINIDDVYASDSRSGGSSGMSGGSGRSKKDIKEHGWRDTDIQIEGPAVAEFQKLFLASWRKQKGEPLNEPDYLPQLTHQGRAAIRAIGSSPDEHTNPAYLTFLAALAHAERSAYITNAYFVPDAQLVDALLAAAARGVDVRLMLPSTTDTPAAAFAARSHYTKLLRGGVRIYEREAALLHAKTVVVDGVWSRVGSSNLDWRSAVDNDELDAVVIDPAFAQAMHRAYAMDERSADEITLEEWEHRPFRSRIKEFFFRLFGRLL